MRRFRLHRGPAQAPIGGEALESLRATFAAVGLPIGDLSDEEIEAGMLDMQDAIRSSGVSDAQVDRALASLARLAGPAAEESAG